jgi:CRP-like cAMP-binding protein
MTSRLAPRLTGWPIDPVVHRLRSLTSLTEHEEALVRGLSDRRERRRPGDEIIVEGQTRRQPRFVVTGWAARQRVLPDGRRQIFSFILPGDAFGLDLRAGATAPWTVTALTAMETIDASPLLEDVCEGRAPGLAQGLAASTLESERLLLDHMVRLGQQTAYSVGSRSSGSATVSVFRCR